MGMAWHGMARHGYKELADSLLWPGAGAGAGALRKGTRGCGKRGITGPLKVVEICYRYQQERGKNGKPLRLSLRRTSNR